MRVAALLALSSCLASSDWRQWRGFSRNGLSPHRVDFDKLPAELSKEWDVEVGTGYSSPIVSKDRVYTFSRQQGKEVAQAWNRATGKAVWRADYAAPFTKNSYAKDMRDGPFATPLLYNDRLLITWGVSGILSCFEASSGHLLWRNDYRSRIETDKLFTGIAASPLGNDGRIYIQVGDDRGGHMLALDSNSGKQVWSADPGGGPGYASPVVHNYRGVSMLIGMSSQNVFALAESDGRLLWSYPFKDQWQENIVTPLVEQDKVYVSGIRNGMSLLQMELQEGGAWTVSRVWHNPEATMYMSSPVLAGDTLYGHSGRRKGQFVALDTATGKFRWESEGRDALSASIILTDNGLLITTVEGELWIVRKDKEKFDVARKYKVADSAVWAHTALADGEIFIKDETRLLKYRGL